MTNSERIFTYRGSHDVSYDFPIDKRVIDFTPVITHPLFNRLRYIGQLRPIDLIISGATHSRREHSLGVYDLGQELLKRRVQSPTGESSNSIDMTEYEQFLFLSLCLLHDVGHGPYSHLYDIISTAYDRQRHTERALDFIQQMEGVIKEASGRHFGYNRPVEDLASMISDRHPLFRLITDKDRLDKWDYVLRDYHYCQSGSVPDIETLINNLHFNGEKSAVHSDARDALRSFLEAYINNNTSIYMKPEVEVCEGFLSRAMIAAVEQGFDIQKGCQLTDEELDDELKRYKTSRELFERIRHNNFIQGSLWAPAACIKPEGYGWLVKEDGEILVEEASNDEISSFTERLKLLDLVARERTIKRELGLDDHELIITFSPQIDRLRIDNSFVMSRGENGGMDYRSIFDVSPGLAEYLTSRLYEHYAVQLISSRDKLQRVRDAVKSSGGFVKMLQ